VKVKKTYEGSKAFLKGRKPGLFVNFGQFCPWIRIRIRIPIPIPNTDPDPRQPNKCGSKTLNFFFTVEYFDF
jgi:hypothetical protein